jgi:hypothetical protein
MLILADKRRTKFVAETVERFNHQTKYSDGEVYRKIRHYQRHDPTMVQDWMIRLTECKQVNLKQILKNQDLSKALDKLLIFPGLWCGLELGNTKRHIATHCTEEMCCYLDHIHNVWNLITQGDTIIQQAVNVQTVQGLQGRAPYMSTVDYEYIKSEIENGILFPTIQDGDTRWRIQQTVLNLRIIVPSIKFFHKNMKLFEIGAGIIKDHLLSKPVRKTLYETLRDRWSPPEGGNAIVEVGEGEYRPAILPAGEVPVRFAYKQLFISALRQFSSLSKHAPQSDFKKEILQGTVDPTISRQFIARARLFGFVTEKTQEAESALVGAGPYKEPTPELNSESEGMKWRCGRPFKKAYDQFKERLFLPYLHRRGTEAGPNLSAIFVQQDFLAAFFGSLDGSVILTVGTPELIISNGVADTKVPTKEASSTYSSSREPSVLNGRSPRLSQAESFSPGIEELLNRFSQSGLQSGLSEHERQDCQWFTEKSETMGICIPTDVSEECRESSSLPSPRHSRRLGILSSRYSSVRPLSDSRETEVSPPLSMDSDRSFIRQASSKISKSSPTTYGHRSFIEFSNLETPHSFHEGTPRSIHERRSFIEIPEFSSRAESNILKYPHSISNRSFTDGRGSFVGEIPNPISDSNEAFISGQQPLIRRQSPQLHRTKNTLTKLRQFQFVEYNGMFTKPKITKDIVSYLRRRNGWTMTVLEHGILKAIQPNHVLEHIYKEPEMRYFLIANGYTEQFKNILYNSARDSDESTLKRARDSGEFGATKLNRKKPR